MRQQDRPLVVTVVGVLLLATGLYLGATLDGDKRSWIGSVGPTVVGLFGVLAAVGAGVAAWAAAQRQITASEQLARRREDEARQTFSAELQPILNMVDLAWVKVDQALQHVTDEQRSTIYFALFNLRYHFGEIEEREIPDIESLLPEMSLRDRRAAITILKHLNAFVAMLNRENEQFDVDHNADRPPDMLRATFVRLALSHLHEALRRFDPQLVTQFAERQKTDVNWAPAAELLAEMKDPNWPN